MKHLFAFLLTVATGCFYTATAQPGSPDPAFGGGDGIVSTSFFPEHHATPGGVAIQPDGRIVTVGGTWKPLSGLPEQMAIARYMPNGSPDPTFDNDGKATFLLPGFSIDANDVIILPDGKILCCGSAWVDDQGYFLLARFLPDGKPDNSFDDDGFVTLQVGAINGYGEKMAVQPDGKIVMVGSANNSGYSEFALVRFKANGTPDPFFGGGDGIVTTPVGESYARVKDIVIQPDGKIVVGGSGTWNGFEDWAALRYNSNGTLDNSFSGDGIASLALTSANDEVQAVLLQPDGKIVLAGSAGQTGNASGDPSFAVARLTAGGQPDNTFHGTGVNLINTNNKPEAGYAAVLQPDGKILLGGCSLQPVANEFIYDFTLLRVTANGQPDNSFGIGGVSVLATSPSSDFMYDLAMQPDGKIVAVGNGIFNNFQNFVTARFLSGLTVGTDAPDVFDGVASVFPNPVSDCSTLQYRLKTDKTLSVNLYKPATMKSDSCSTMLCPPAPISCVSRLPTAGTPSG